MVGAAWKWTELTRDDCYRLAPCGGDLLGLSRSSEEESCGRNEFRGPSIFLELASDQVGDGVERGVGVGAIGAYGDDRAVAGGEHHQAHDALAIDFLAILLDEDVGLEAIGRFDKLGGGTGVDAELVEDGEILFGHG